MSKLIAVHVFELPSTRIDHIAKEGKMKVVIDELLRLATSISTTIELCLLQLAPFFVFLHTQFSNPWHPPGM
jgi:predicted metallopeptidase